MHTNSAKRDAAKENGRALTLHWPEASHPVSSHKIRKLHKKKPII